MKSTEPCTMVIQYIGVVYILNILGVQGFLFNSKVCYDETGCFADGHPFHNALGELPDSPKSIQTRAYLWTWENPTEAQELDYLNMSSISASNFDPLRPTKLLIHGYMSSKEAAPIVANLSVAYIKQGDYNVIGIDWAPGAKALYPKAVANTRVTGAVLANLITTLRDKFGMKLSDLHVLGHSLGAHVSGYIGRRIPGIARITGLDPAGPMFTGTDPVVRLDPSDAQFVDCIHSDAVPIQDAGFGTQQALGHVDFYPNGGLHQPGCPPPVSSTAEELLTGKFAEAFDSVSCSHDRAIWYYIESVLDYDNGCQFYATPCDSWGNFTSGVCAPCQSSSCKVMGIKDSTGTGTGKFYLNINPSSPYCSGNVSFK